MARVLTSTVLLSLLATAVHAQPDGSVVVQAPEVTTEETDTSIFRPARFPVELTPITNLIEFPDYEEDLTVQVFCDVIVTRLGNFANNYCFSNQPGSGEFVRATVKEIGRGRIEPARVDDLKVEVSFHYTVLFEQSDGVRNISLLPHQFDGFDGPYDGYSAPQRYYDSINIPCGSPYYMLFEMTIPPAGGKPTNVTLMNPEDGTECEPRTRAIVEDGLYIPAFLNGVPVAATYREVWWSR